MKMHPTALRLGEMALALEGSNMPEIVTALDIAARAINTLHEESIDPNSGSTWKAVAELYISRCDQLSKKLRECGKLEANTCAVLEAFGDFAVRVREGGGPEDIAASLAVTCDKVRRELERLDQLINTPHINDFLQAVNLEAAHQREKWSREHDEGKQDTDWFWLIGYLAGKALQAGQNPPDAVNVAATPPRPFNTKQMHHIVTTAAALANWHAMRMGADTRMRPGIEEPKGFSG